MARQSSIAESGFVNKMKNTGRNVVVFYGSQTGTGEEFAARLAKEANRFGMKAMVADPEECEMEELSNLSQIENSLAIFCLATYGEGDPTDNAQEFYEWLQSSAGELNGLNYAVRLIACFCFLNAKVSCDVCLEQVFGLGNKTYEHYNEMAKYVDKRLHELGATRVHEVGMGDDDAK